MKHKKLFPFYILSTVVLLSSCGTFEMSKHRYSGGFHFSLSRNKKQAIEVADYPARKPNKKSKEVNETMAKKSVITISNEKPDSNKITVIEKTKIQVITNYTGIKNMVCHNPTTQKDALSQPLVINTQKTINTSVSHDDDDESVFKIIVTVLFRALLLSAAIVGLFMLLGVSFSGAMSILGAFWLWMILDFGIVVLSILLLILMLKALFSDVKLGH